MGFIATGNAPPTGARTTPNTVENDGWFPDIVLTELRAATRLDGTVTHERLLPAVIAAMISVNRELLDWQHEHFDTGIKRLADVAGPRVGGLSVFLTLYHRAVYSTVRADLIERYRDFDSTAEGHDKADRLDPAVDAARRNARCAIRDILGTTHITVELI